MAEINQPSSPSGGKIRSRKRSTRIDMTPMVDLAFSLLTFFILTRTFIDPRMMQVDMPDPTGEPAPVNEKNLMNVVIAGEGKVFWWIADESTPHETDLSASGIRKVLLTRVRSNPKMMVLIKPMDEASFTSVVDVLDEMNIVGVQRYAIADVTDDDRALIGD